MLSGAPARWGDFLRYAYYRFDFSKVTEPGMYVVRYGDRQSQPFRIAADVYARGAWQPTLEYFLPVQMSHMRVNEKYRVWHGLDHMDDARMAPVSLNHFDGYAQGPSTLTKFKPGDVGAGPQRRRLARRRRLRPPRRIADRHGLAARQDDRGVRSRLRCHHDRRDSSHRRDPRAGWQERRAAADRARPVDGHRRLSRHGAGLSRHHLPEPAAICDARRGGQPDRQCRERACGRPRPRQQRPPDHDGRPLGVHRGQSAIASCTSPAGLAAASRVERKNNPALSAETLAAARTLYDRAIDRAKSTSQQGLCFSRADSGYRRQRRSIAPLSWRWSPTSSPTSRTAPGISLRSSTGFRTPDSSTGSPQLSPPTRPS